MIGPSSADTVSVVVGDGWRIGHRPGLDQLRAVAVALVVVDHSLSGNGVPTQAAHVGVSLFFVLSGFLITRLLLEQRPSVFRFYVRRAVRLMPALAAGVALAAVVNSHLGLATARPAFAALTYHLNYARVGENFGAFEHLWSLAVEEHFYAVWPVVLALAPRRLLVPGCLALVVGVGAARTVTAWDNEALAYNATHLRIDAMLVGAVLAACITRASFGWRSITLAVVVLVIFGSGAAGRSDVSYGATAIYVASAVIVAWGVTVERRRTALEYVGRISYGIYLYHVPMVLLLGSSLSGAALVLAVTSTTLVLAAASYRWLEQPVRRLVDPVRHEERSSLDDGPGAVGRRLRPLQLDVAGGPG